MCQVAHIGTSPAGTAGIRLAQADAARAGVDYAAGHQNPAGKGITDAGVLARRNTVEADLARAISEAT